MRYYRLFPYVRDLNKKMSGTGLCINLSDSILSNKERRMVLIASLSLIINSIYAASNIIVGLKEKSYWFITAGTYYLILAVIRFCIILSEKRSRTDTKEISIRFIRCFTGIMLIIMSTVLCGSVYLSLFHNETEKLNEILVITLASYSFTKITLAIINFTKRKKLNSQFLSLIRNIGLADAAVSIFSLQKSMLVSFPGMSENEIMIMNGCTGSVVWMLVLLIGIGIIYKKKRRNQQWQIQK